MGYNIDQRETKFCVKRKSFEGLIHAVNRLSQPCIWVDRDVINAAVNDFFNGGDAVDCVRKIFTEFQWPVKIDGDIRTIYLGKEKLGDDDVFFDAIAPYVEDGSFITLLGEDGNMWKWKFDKGRLHEVNSRVVWDDE